MKVRKVSVWTAGLLVLGVLGAAAAFAWFFLRSKVQVTHTVAIDPNDTVHIDYHATP